MELVDVFPILAVTSVVLLMLIKIYFKLRHMFPTIVNCWFCNCDAKVPYRHRNSWVCPSCDQYNGFNADGGYNVQLPAQYDEYLNVPTCSTPLTKVNRQAPTLCDRCNANQNIKVSQLAAFSPINKDKYGEEVELYSQQLEKVYGLCRNCHFKLSNLFKKENEHFKDVFKNIPPISGDQRVSKIQKTPSKSAFLYYGAKFSCLLQQADILAKHIPSDYFNLALLYVPKDLLNLNLLPSAVSGYNNVLSEYWEMVQYKEDVLRLGLVSLCVLLYFFEFLSKRKMLSFLNLAVWSILLSLKYFDSPYTNYVTAVQGLTCAVFLFTNRKKGFVVDVAAKTFQEQKIETNEQFANKNNVDIVYNAPYKNNLKTSSVQTGFNSVPKPRKTLSTKTNSNEPKHIEDFGISKLKIGATRRETGTGKNLNELKMASYLNRPILSPPRLNINERTFTTNNLQKDGSPSETRCSSRTSGIYSMLHQNDMNDRCCDFDSCGQREMITNQLLQPQMYAPYEPTLGGQMALGAFNYYQFAAMFQKMCTPPGSPSASFSLDNSSRVSECRSLCSHGLLFNVLISLIVLSNFSLFGLMYYKEFLAGKV